MDIENSDCSHPLDRVDRVESCIAARIVVNTIVCIVTMLSVLFSYPIGDEEEGDFSKPIIKAVNL